MRSVATRASLMTALLPGDMLLAPPAQGLGLRSARWRLRHRNLLVLLALLNGLAVALALPAKAGGPAYLVEDINTIGRGGSFPSLLTDVQGTLYFIPTDETQQHSLWRSDGTEVGTVLVSRLGLDRDTLTGPFLITHIQEMVFVLFEVRRADGSGLQLWKSDGTDSGTTLVREIRPGANTALGTPVGALAAANDTLYFVVLNDQMASPELWTSDGTPAGTTVLKRFASRASGIPSNLTPVGDTMFFLADDGVSGGELWKSDGTEEGTVLVRDIRPGPGESTFPVSFRPWLTNANGRLFLVADDGEHAAQVWTSDGTEAGTIPVSDFHPDSSISRPTALTDVNGTLFFAANSAAELWRSDGTPDGTRRIKVFADPPSSITSLVGVSGALFILTDNGALWASDGTEAGTTLVSEGLHAFNLTAADDTLYFVVSEAYDMNELWKSNGSPEGTVRVKSFPTPYGPENLTNVNGTLFFAGTDGSTEFRELWKSDGTEAGTTMVKRLSSGTKGAFLPPYGENASGNLTEAGGMLFFFPEAAPTASLGLWQSDGTATGTGLVKDVLAPQLMELNSRFPGPVQAGGTLFFIGAARDGSTGYELWRSDGTLANTVLVKDIQPGPQSAFRSDVSSLIAVSGAVYFVADYEPGQPGLWRSDGTEKGTVFVKDISLEPPLEGHLYPQDLTDVNGTLYFLASNGRALWKSDGTPTGTVRVKQQIRASRLTNVNGIVFFAATDDSADLGLWKSDGTEAGTIRVKGIGPGLGSFFPDRLTNVGGTLFFSAEDAAAGRELWKSDGTEAGTVRVKDICPGECSSLSIYIDGVSIPAPVAVNGTLFFVADDHSHGLELWKSDGTEAGTSLVKDIWPGPGSSVGSVVTRLTIVNGRVLFTAKDPVNGLEMWESDGTEAGTVLVQDIAPGELGSSPSPAVVAGTHIFFTADDGITGTELWAAPVAEIAPCTGDCNGDGFVTVDELIRGVSIALVEEPLDQCPAFDTDGNQIVTINELLSGVTNTLSGCRG
jgi:ELWxxDGT repeat protein